MLFRSEPMPNEDESVWLVFNGEIYNFLELRTELEAAGHIFRSNTDTEVIVHGYEEWGVGVLQRMIGMFAFALWDERRKRLWLVRDRLGIKPMFYARIDQGILFGSEIKALLEHPAVTRDLDYQALDYFLSLNYTPAPHTLFKQVRQLNPGQYLLADLNGGVQMCDYWDVRYEEDGGAFDERLLVEEFTVLLEDAVRRRLISDVPLGSFLSGGIDSSSVAYFAAAHMGEPLKAFTIGFGEQEFDETDYARLVAYLLGAEHYVQEVAPDLATILDRKSTRLNSSHSQQSRMPSSA